jgi:hypothetical protein
MCNSTGYAKVICSHTHTHHPQQPTATQKLDWILEFFACFCDLLDPVCSGIVDPVRCGPDSQHRQSGVATVLPLRHGEDISFSTELLCASS